MSDAARMWSLERLAAALGMALVAFIAATRLMASWPDPIAFGNFRVVSAGLGFIIGWRVIGIRLGHGAGVGFSVGLTASLILLFSAFLLFSIYTGISRNMSMGSSTGGIAPDVALRGYFNIMKVWAGNLTDPYFWAILMGGGPIVGMIADLLSPRRP